MAKKKKPRPRARKWSEEEMMRRAEMMKEKIKMEEEKERKREYHRKQRRRRRKLRKAKFEASRARDLLKVPAFREITHNKKRAFLIAYALTGVKFEACGIVGMSMGTLYSDRWRNDEEFQNALVRAEEMSGDILEAEAHRRAVEGTEEPVGWYKGEPGGTVRKYSDTLLIVLLKMRGRFVDAHQQRLAGADGGELPTAINIQFESPEEEDEED